MGYANGGGRLWRNSTSSGLAVWIGGIYEERDGKKLCHVLAGGRRIATFEPQTGMSSVVGNNPILAASTSGLATAFYWPLQQGRTPTTQQNLDLIV